MQLQYIRDNLAEKLRAHGINPTHQRLEIAHALFSRCEHLSADQIMSIVNERHSETSKATVYNTLNLFLEKKLIREVIVDPNKVFYDPNTSTHYHMYDIESGKLTNIEPHTSAFPDCRRFRPAWSPRAWTSLSVCVPQISSIRSCDLGRN